MCSYNSVSALELELNEHDLCLQINGVPACANRELLTEVLRNKWNFTGFVVSDCGKESETECVAVLLAFRSCKQRLESTSFCEFRIGSG